MGASDRPPRPLGALALLALGINGVVGVGIFFAPQAIATQIPGFGSIVVFALTAVALLPVAAAVSTLGAHVHEDGGPVLYARRAFGETVGFTVGWITYVSALLSTSTVLVGLTQALLGGAYTRLAAAGLGTILALACALGLHASARIWTTLTVLKLVPLLALAGLTLLAPAPRAMSYELPVHADWLRACLTAMFVFQGFEIVPLLAGQAKRPARTMPLAVLGSLLSATALYLVLQRGAVLGVPDLANETAPLVASARGFGSTGLARVVGYGTSLSALGIAFGMMTTTPRYLSALALGTRFADERRGVSRRALALSWALVMLLVLALGELGELFVLSSLAVVVQFLVIALALMQLARTRQFGLRPRDAWSALPTIAVAVVLWTAATPREWLIAAALVVAGMTFRLLLRLGKR